MSASPSHIITGYRKGYDAKNSPYIAFPLPDDKQESQDSFPTTVAFFLMRCPVKECAIDLLDCVRLVWSRSRVKSQYNSLLYCKAKRSIPLYNQPVKQSS